MVREGQPPASPGALLGLIRSGRYMTRSSISVSTGLSRSRISELLTPLLGQGFVTEARGPVAATGGRPPGVLSFNAEAGALVLIDLAARPARVALTNLAGHVLAEATLDVDLRTRPQDALARVDALAGDLLMTTVPGPDAAWAIGVAVPDPVALGGGFDVADWLRARHHVPVVVERQVTAATLAEHRVGWAQAGHMLYVRVDHGVSCGIMSDGRLHRGHSGAAGGIAHLPVPGCDAVCWCGGFGCLEAAVEAILRPPRFSALRDEALQRAGRVIGEALSLGVCCLNPELVVIAGATRRAGEQLLVGAREGLALPEGVHGPQLQPAQLGRRASTLGLALLAADAVLASDAIDGSLAWP